MSKRIMGLLLVCIMLVNCIVCLTPVATVYAFNNYEVEVTKNNAPLREGYYESEKVIKRYSKGTVLTVVGEKKNIWGNLWYKIKGGGYIFNENVKKVTKKHQCSFKLKGYEKAHPHLSNYECSCGNGYCGTDTKKMDGCKECYPHVCSFKFKGYEKAHPHLSNYECSCGNGYCGTDTTKIDGCKECYPHVCSFKFKGYEKAHPHLSNYECSCGNGYCGTDTTKVDGCSECYPHVCSFKFKGYEKAHPHLSNYECSCGNGYCGTDTTKVDGCKECYPHECSFELVGYEDVHPHLSIYECSCGNGYCGNDTRKVKSCQECFPKKEEVHKCVFEFIGYDESHPHSELYECSCGNGYSGSKNKKDKNCNICYPEEDDDDDDDEDGYYGHSCFFRDTGIRRNQHPHYVVEECGVCGKQRENRMQPDVFVNCIFCINEEPFNNFNSPFNFNLYDVGRGQYVYFKVSSIETGGADVSSTLHSMLDVCGIAAPEPAAMICDGINVLYYLVEKDYVNTGLSLAAIVPFAGIMSTSGKIYKKAGTVVIDTAASTADDLIKATTKVVIKNPDLISDAAGQIVKNSSKYSDDVLETIGKISRNESVSLGNVYYNNKLLISRDYTGTIVSPAGIKYAAGSAEGHRLYHITERHGAKLKGTKGHGTLFAVDDSELFSLIDDVYSEGRLVGKPVTQANGNVKKIYQSSKKVGYNGEMKLEMIFKGDKLVTAYPVK